MEKLKLNKKQGKTLIIKLLNKIFFCIITKTPETVKDLMKKRGGQELL